MSTTLMQANAQWAFSDARNSYRVRESAAQSGAGEFVVESFETSQLEHSVNGLRVDCEIAREAMARLSAEENHSLDDLERFADAIRKGGQ